MATTSGILSSSEQIQANYEKYKDKFKDASADLVSTDTFLNLLVAEMTNQDPMEPTSNTEFVTQMAQFTSLQYAKDSSTYSKSNYASNLVGKTVTASKMDGPDYVVKTGVVESVAKNGDKYTIKIDGVTFDISNVTSITETKTDNKTDDTTTGGMTGSSLGDLITRASSMIGLWATVNPKVSGGSMLDSGLITSIQVKDGQVRIIINDNSYALDDIIEVAYPLIIDDDSNGDTTDGTEGTTDGTESTEGTDSSTSDDTTQAAGQSLSADKQEAIAQALEQAKTDNLEQVMTVIDNMNAEGRETELERLHDYIEQVEEVKQRAEADVYLDRDIPDLEDFA